MNVSVTTNKHSIFRYIAVCFPLRSRWIFTLKRTRIGIVFVCIFAILYNVTRFLEYETIVEYIPVSVNITNGDTLKVICGDIKICDISELNPIYVYWRNDKRHQSNFQNVTNSNEEIRSIKDNSTHDRIKMESRPTLTTTDLRTNPLYIAVYINWMYLVTMYIIPFIILLLLNLRWVLRIKIFEIFLVNIIKVHRWKNSSIAILFYQ